MDTRRGDPGSAFPADGLVGLLDKIDRLLTGIGHRVSTVDRLLARGLLSAEGLLLGLSGLLLLLLLTPLVERLLRRIGRVEANFRGDRIPQSFGLLILIWSVTMLAATVALLPRLRSAYTPWLIACSGFGILGLVDDLWGDRRVKGLRGHLNAALHERRITTGLLKAVGGVALGLWIGFHIDAGSLWRSLLSAALIALGANAVNLLDLRPGRAGGVFLFSSAVLIARSLMTSAAGAPPLLLIAIPALVVWEKDARARVMMGDTGSNLLGGCLGLALATICPLPVQCAAFALLVALHAAAERVSLSRVIENNALLRALDHLAGTR